jgi:uncharacterized protein YlxW (UPF0749 family)
MSEQILMPQLPKEVVNFVKTVAIKVANEVELELKTAELKQKRLSTEEYQKRKSIREQIRALPDNTPFGEVRKLQKQIRELTKALDKKFAKERAEIKEIKETIVALKTEILKSLATEPIKSIATQ